MDKDAPGNNTGLDVREMHRALARIAERSRRAVAEFLDRQSRDTALADLFDPLQIGDAFLRMTAQSLAGPARIVEAQMSLWSNYLQLWQHTARSMLGEDEPAAAGEPWNQAELFDFVRQSYLLTARWIQALLRADDPLGRADAQMVDFHTRQVAEYLSPAAFFEANPDLLGAIGASHGDVLVRGLDHLLAELERGKARLSGRGETRRRAATPGKSVFRNAAIDLLHYTPTTAKVHRTPLLIVAPWNARHHLLDLEPASSLVKWAVERCHSVFMLSWLPPEAAPAERDFGDTLKDGPLAALDAIAELTGERRVNGVGFGPGGTLLAAMAARGEDRFASATYLGGPVDFSQADESPPPIDLLRANDILWSFVVDCLHGAAPPLPFAALRWNSDSLSLAEPGGRVRHGTPIDLGGITAPAYVLAGREDRLSPWRSAFAATRLFGGPVRFVLAPSGQAGSILSPPGRARGYWTNGRRAKDAETWLRNAARQDGSWWEDWARWITPLSGPLIAT